MNCQSKWEIGTGSETEGIGNRIHKSRKKYHRIGQPKNKSRYIHLKQQFPLVCIYRSIYIPSNGAWFGYLWSVGGQSHASGSFLWLYVTAKAISNLFYYLFPLFAVLYIYIEVYWFIYEATMNWRFDPNAFFPLFAWYNIQIDCVFLETTHLNTHKKTEYRFSVRLKIVAFLLTLINEARTNIIQCLGG